MSTTSDPPLRPASTVIVLRDDPEGGPPDVFMVRRHQGTAFMGGAFVFPGGRVDASDRDTPDDRWCDETALAAARFPDLPADEAIGYHVAAIRELFEEAGVLLARDGGGHFVSLTGADAHSRFAKYRKELHAERCTLRDVVEQEGLRLALDALVPWAHWVTPAMETTRRFDTRFFLTRAPERQAPAHDETETTAGVWISAPAAIARSKADEIMLPPPTWTTLRELEPFASVEAALTHAKGRPIVRREPMFLEQDGRRMLLLAGDPLNPEPLVEEMPLETRFVFESEGVWRAARART